MLGAKTRSTLEGNFKQYQGLPGGPQALNLPSIADNIQSPLKGFIDLSITKQRVNKAIKRLEASEKNKVADRYFNKNDPNERSHSTL